MALLGLVADYSSSDEENTKLEEKLTKKESGRESSNFFETSGDTSPLEKKTKKCKKSKKEKLMNPLKGFMNNGNSLPYPFQSDDTTSVFYNPFHKEREAKKQMLEKHVKLTENPRDVVEINGKKICFNYRKGRCKFGHNCKFAHDSDLSTDAVPTTISAITNATNNITTAAYNTSSSIRHEGQLQDESKRKRKPGLSESLVPCKKSREDFRKQQGQEAPWRAKR